MSSSTIRAISKGIKSVATRKNSVAPKNKSVMDDVCENQYLKMCKQKRGRNHKFLKQVVDDIKRGKKSTPRNLPRSRTEIQLGIGDTNTSPKKKKGTCVTTTVAKPRRIFNSKNKRDKDKTQFKCAHRLTISFEQETDKRYCNKGMDLEGVSCSKCKLKFGQQGMPPAINKPIWVCNNRRLSGCTHSLCSACYFDMSDGSSKRRTRR